MRNFFKIFFASLFAMIIFSVLAFFILIAIIAGMTSPEKPDTGNKAVLVLDLNKEYKEQEVDDPVNFLTGKTNDNTPGLYDVIRMIHFAKTDSAVKGIYIKCDDNANAFASSEELRDAIIDFRKSKKFVIAYGDVITQKAYYVASAADRVYANPQGSVEWKGLSTTIMFLKGALEKLEIEPQIFYAGKFKSATEPLRAYEMSEPNKLQTSQYLNELYSRLLVAASVRSGLDTAQLHTIANKGLIQTARQAAETHLIDAVKYDDEVKDEIIKHLKLDNADKINFVSLGKYAKAADYKTITGSKIALIYAQGDIMDGKEQENAIGSDYYRNLIRKARLNKDVKAIVFRVNSPGGSALASEEIWREITLAKKVKPVVVSFGDVAASGGYYISCNADSIFAQPNTITGSIGVFGILPNMKKFFNNKLGVTFDGVKTGPLADMPSVSRPLNDVEKVFVQNMIDTIYSTFKSRVAQGRKLSPETVDSIAQGRVWTGEKAVALGLVDKLGSINDAINCAARMAKLNTFAIKEYPEKKNFIEKIFDKYENDVKEKSIKEEIGIDQYKLLKQIQYYKAMMNVPQTRLPFELNFR